jgi:hypothetical protein
LNASSGGFTGIGSSSTAKGAGGFTSSLSLLPGVAASLGSNGGHRFPEDLDAIVDMDRKRQLVQVTNNMIKQPISFWTYCQPPVVSFVRMERDTNLIIKTYNLILDTPH